ncbi:MAG: PadR family transcriptional regulator [Promethearchaeota archaeon]
MSKQIKLFLPTPEKLTPIQLLVMIQLLGTSKYGYEIIRNLREGFKGSWEPKTGTVYPALRALEKKGIIAKSMVSEKTHYSLTVKGRGIMQEISDYVADYLLFNSRFIESTVDSMPPSFTQEVFSKIHEAGIDEILPEATILEAIRQLSDNDLKRAFLELRKETLLRKLGLVRKQLKDLD